MKQLKTLAEAQAAFLQFSPFDMKGKYELGRMRELMRYLGDPQGKLKVIHIAGTSGKTSTAYYIRGLLETAGKRTGLTISPHITSITERVQLDGKPLDETRFLNYVNQFLPLVEQFHLQPTYFELLVALAYWIFAKEKVDYAVIETGLGGLLDGTNVVTRKDKVCVITEIGLDHTEILGDTIEAIAEQKAGIIQPGNQVFMLQQAAEAVDVIRRAVQQKDAALKMLQPIIETDLLPFQARNWVLARAVFEYVAWRDDILVPGEDMLKKVLTQTPPGRLEIYRFKGKTVILDGAHNPQELEALLATLRQKGITLAAIMANFKQAPQAKIETLLRTLQPLASHLIIPEFSAGQDLKSLQAVPADELKKVASTAGFQSAEAMPNAAQALEVLLQRREKTLIITGSLYLISAIRPLILQKFLGQTLEKGL